MDTPISRSAFLADKKEEGRKIARDEEGARFRTCSAQRRSWPRADATAAAAEAGGRDSGWTSPSRAYSDRSHRLPACDEDLPILRPSASGRARNDGNSSSIRKRRDDLAISRCPSVLPTSCLPCMLIINDLRGSEVVGWTDGGRSVLLIIPHMHARAHGVLTGGRTCVPPSVGKLLRRYPHTFE